MVIMNAAVKITVGQCRRTGSAVRFVLIHADTVSSPFMPGFHRIVCRPFALDC